MKTYKTIVLSLLALVIAAPLAQADLIYATRVNALNAAGNSNYFSNYNFSNSNSSNTWCTQQNNGNGTYIVNDDSIPIMLCDLGAIQTINGIQVIKYPWGRNPVATMRLDFYDTPAISGTPIASKTLSVEYDSSGKSVINWDNSVNARYVKITLTENQGHLAGSEGDRFGVSDLMFDVSSVATPSSASCNVANYSNYTSNNLIDKDPTTQWCSSAFNDSGYFSNNPQPEFTFTFNDPQTLTGIAVQPYRESTGNSIKTFKLEFYDSDGNLLSVQDDPNYSFTMTDSTNGVQNYFSFPTINNVASLKMTVTGNFRGVGNGGDRIGLSEVYFSTLETKTPSTPVMYNEPMHADNIVRPMSAEFANEVSQRVTNTDPNYALSNLIDGSGTDGGKEWSAITSENDYYNLGYTPSIIFTMPEESLYDSFSIWGFDVQGSQMTDFTLELYNDADQLVFADEFKILQSINENEFATFSLGDNYSFSKARLTALDNAYYWFGANGGNQVGFAEIAFYQDPNAISENGVPEPSTWALLILGAAGMLYYRKQK